MAKAVKTKSWNMSGLSVSDGDEVGSVPVNFVTGLLSSMVKKLQNGRQFDSDGMVEMVARGHRTRRTTEQLYGRKARLLAASEKTLKIEPCRDKA